MAIPDSIFKQMVIKFKAARVFHPNGCITLNDRMPNINLDTQRNQVRIQINKQGREYKITARRIAIYLKTGKLPDQPVYVTCSNFHCVNPEHLRLGEYGDRSSVRNDKRDCRTEELNRKLGKSKRVRNSRHKRDYSVYTYSEEHHISDPSKMPEWAKYPDAIEVKAETIK